MLNRDWMLSFGANLRELMDLADLNNVELATSMGIDPSAVTHWLQGNSCPHLSRLQDLAAALGCTIGALIPPEKRTRKTTLRDVLIGHERRLRLAWESELSRHGVNLNRVVASR